MRNGRVFLIWLILSVLIIGFKTENGAKKNDTPEGSFITISPEVYLYKDICNVYVLKSGTSALLIDAGSGKIKDHLKEIGVDRVEWVLHTHYHRDQTAGSSELKKSGARIAIGESEAHILQRPDATAPFIVTDQVSNEEVQPVLFNGELPGWGRRMAPFTATGIDKKLTDGEVFNWNQYRITVINTPGHTFGSISFLVETDSKRLCFTGDLIMKGGHIRDLYSMQWIYLRNPGIDSSIISLGKVKDAVPDLLLPSHGGVIDHPSEDIGLLDIRLKKVRDALNIQRAGRWNWSEFVQVSRNVIQDGGSTTQIVISDSGEALLFDCGKEFSPERLQQAKDKFGITRVDVIIPSHWHFDHIDGIAEIVESEGARVWVWEGLAGPARV